MNTVRSTRLWAWAAFIVLAVLSVPALAASRVALVIGNTDYEHTTPLRNPRHDATDMARELRGLGFEVIEGLDLHEMAFESKLRAFARASRGAEVTLFFYAGHALQVDGENYLVPTDAKLVDEVGLERETFKLAAFLREMRGDTNLVFLDACRDNPLAKSLARSMGRTRSSAVGRGLKRIETEGGKLIAYATQPGNVAEDGDGRNSPFTAALLAHLASPGLSVHDMLTVVTGAVVEDTHGQQEPWVHSSLREPFYFKLEIVADTGSVSEDAARAYEAAERINTIEAYGVIPKRFPDTTYADLARAQIAKLKAETTKALGATTTEDAGSEGATVPTPSSQQPPAEPTPAGLNLKDAVATPAPEAVIASPMTATDDSLSFLAKRTWKAKYRNWTIELKINGRRVDAILRDKNSGTGSALRCRNGKINDMGEISAWCQAPGYGRRRLEGIFPNIELVNRGGGSSGGASFVFELDG